MSLESRVFLCAINKQDLINEQVMLRFHIDSVKEGACWDDILIPVIPQLMYFAWQNALAWGIKRHRAVLSN